MLIYSSLAAHHSVLRLIQIWIDGSHTVVESIVPLGEFDHISPNNEEFPEKKDVSPTKDRSIYMVL